MVVIIALPITLPVADTWPVQSPEALLLGNVVINLGHNN